MIVYMFIMMSLWTCYVCQGGPCDSISCRFNALCDLHPVTEEWQCVCPEQECFGARSKPICGSNNKTYDNMCLLHLQSCLQQTEISFAHYGSCGIQRCTSNSQCEFGSLCENGKCVCRNCSTVLSREEEVCGTNYVTYPSRCYLQKEACSKRMSIYVMKSGSCNKTPRRTRQFKRLSESNHLKNWMTSFATASDQSTTTNRVSTLGHCRTLNLDGCFSHKFRHSRFLGIYHATNIKTFGAYVYKKILRRGRQSRVYLSRVFLRNDTVKSWIVGRQPGTGKGWIGTRDPHVYPDQITNKWTATTGNKNKTWEVVPSLKAECIHPKRVREKEECKYGSESGRRGKLHDRRGNPEYSMKISGKLFGNKYYKPKNGIKVKIAVKRDGDRMQVIYVHMDNREEKCGIPTLRKGKKRYRKLCGGELLQRKSKRGFKRISLHLTTPTRGCVTVRVFIKSTKNAIYYDEVGRKTNHPRNLPLTKTICNQFQPRL